MYATLAEVSETERDLEGTGLTPKKDTKKKRTSTATSTGPSTAEDPIQDLLMDQEDQEALMEQAAAAAANPSIAEDLSCKNLIIMCVCVCVCVCVCLFLCFCFSLYNPHFIQELLIFLVQVCMEIVREQGTRATAGSGIFRNPPMTKEVAQKAVDKLPAKQFYRQVNNTPIKPLPHHTPL